MGRSNQFIYVCFAYEDNSEVKHLLSRSEESLVQSIYEDVIAPTSVLRLKMELEKLSNERFSSEESFLVTRINGKWDLRSIVTITPLREVDALRIVKRLLERDIIEVCSLSFNTKPNPKFTNILEFTSNKSSWIRTWWLSC